MSLTIMLVKMLWEENQTSQVTRNKDNATRIKPNFSSDKKYDKLRIWYNWELTKSSLIIKEYPQTLTKIKSRTVWRSQRVKEYPQTLTKKESRICQKIPKS